MTKASMIKASMFGALAMVAIAAGALSGCVSPAELAKADRNTCSSFGYAPNTDAFADCMMVQDQQRARQQAAWQAQQQRAWQQQQAQQQKQQDAFMHGDSGDTRAKTDTSMPAMPDMSQMDCQTTEDVTTAATDAGNAGRATTTTHSTTHCKSH